MSLDHSDSSSVHSQTPSTNSSHPKTAKSNQNTEMDDFFTASVVDVLCYSDSTDMRASLLEEIVNQKKQELLRSPEVNKWIAEKEKEKIQQEGAGDKDVSNNMMETNNSNPDQPKAHSDSAIKVSKFMTENKTLAQTQVTSHIPVHPSVYTMNRQVGVGKTQAKTTKQ